MGITHATVATGTDAGTGEIHKAQWNADHDLSDIVDLPTAETDDTLVLAPDGVGGVEFRAEAGGGTAAESAAARIYAYNTFK